MTFTSYGRLPAACVLLLAAAAPADELRVFPPAVSLSTDRDSQRVIVQRVADDGVTRDVSGEAEWSLGEAAVATIEGDVLTPAADGETVLSVRHEGLSAEIPVTLTAAERRRDLRFAVDVMPIFSKAGCNTGSCHGAARGKDGFRLSLFGYDPDGDYQRLTRELPGRRVNLASPAQSLVVEKAVAAVPHTGGKLFDVHSAMYSDLVAWLAKGAPKDPQDTPTCDGIELYPPSAVLIGVGAVQPATVVARYSDGTTRDVTSLTYFQSNNAGVADVDAEGRIVSGEAAGQRPGEAFVLARFDKYTVGSQVIALPPDLDYTPPAEQPQNYVDQLVAAKLQKLRLEPSGRSTDEEFLRRVTIDLVGLMPTPEEYAAFLADESPDKRDAKIEELLARKEFTEIWVSKWAEWLQMRSDNNRNISYKSVVLYYSWLRDQIAREVPVDAMVRDLLSGTGGTFSVPQTNFYQMEQDPLKVAENTAQTFMGMQIQCAQCHNHPFDRWTQDDYYGFNAFFAQVGRKRSEDFRETIVFNRGGGETKHPVTGKNVAPVFLGGGTMQDNGIDLRGKDRRAVLAEWLASPENPYFARNIVNRVWHHFFGIGIVDPVDDVRVSNPASNPQLLDELARRFTESGYDFKQLVRDVVTSETYQRTSERNASNASDEVNFAHQTVRRIKAESMLDIISQVTATEDKFRGLPKGANATQIADGTTSTYFLTTFGRAKRETVCTCEVKMEPTLSQALHLLNGENTNVKVRQGKLVETLLAEGLSPIEVVERLYVRCFTRLPTDAERAAMQAAIDEVDASSGGAVRDRVQDIFWALLNSREMLFNH